MDSYINLGGHADTLIPHTPGRGGGDGVGDGGRRLVRRGGMGALTTDGRSLMTVSCYTKMTRGMHGRFLLQSLTSLTTQLRSL